MVWEKWLLVNDFHAPYHDDKLLKLFLAFAKSFKPDHLVILGDGFDFYQLSSFQQDPKRLNTLQDEIDLWVEILKQFASLAPSKTYLEGNHEYRLRKFLNVQAKPLNTLRALTVPALFHLQALGFRYVPCTSLDKFIHNWITVGRDLWVGHFDKVNKYSAYTAKNLVEEFHISIVQAHTHRGGTYHARDSRGFLRGDENFCMCGLSPSYVKGPNWQHGWTVVYKKVGNPRFQVVPINVVDYGFFWGDKEWQG